jgi:CubicO group peptidase (beta-lactamase class C family)
LYTPTRPAPDEELLGSLSAYPVGDSQNYFFNEAVRVGSFSRMDEIDFSPGRIARLPASAQPMPLPVSSQTEPFTNHFFYTYQGKQHSLADYLSRQRVMGLMVLKGGQRWFEAYQYQRTPSMRFLGHSFAKSMTSLAFGHALQEGIFASLDIRSDVLAPVLRGSLYGEATLRQLLHMSSGVQFDDRYDGQGDTAVFSRIAAQQGIAAAAHHLRVREIADGERFAYSSAQTSVLSLVFQSVVGEDLASFVGKQLWQAMGAESEALWLQDRFGVVRASGSFCATLADYARWGLVLANNGYRPDTGEQVFFQDYLLDATDWHKHPLACQPGMATPGLGYGLHFWTFPGHPRRFMLMGVYGQFMFVAPDLQLVMVQLGAGAEAKNADTPMAQEALALWRGLLDCPLLRVNQSDT